MSTRLTNDARKNIVRKLMQRAFDTQDQALQHEGGKVLEAVIKDFHRAHWSLIEQMPEGWMSTVIEKRFKVRGDGDDVTLKAPYPIRTSKAFPQSSYYDGISLASLKPALTASAYNKLEAHLDKVTAHNALKEKTRDEITAMVNSVTTYKKLYEIWPELGEAIPLVDPDSGMGKQLAPNTAELNRVLGLGKKDKK